MYLSTRNKADSFTAHRVLRSDCAPDGGLFMPMLLKVQDDFSLAAYEQMNAGETIASILNLFFGTQLSGWDVDFAVGRQAVELVSCGYKICLAESWHNPKCSHEYFVNRLYSLVTGEKETKIAPNLWFRTAVNIALLFCIYGKYSRQEIYLFDVALETGDLQLFLAVRYAQKMGLPVRSIVLGASEDDGLWELFSHGEYQPSKDHHVEALESLIWLEYGYSETEKYLYHTARKMTYCIRNLDEFRKGVFPAVVGDRRINSVIENTLHISNYSMTKDTASAYGALQDFRAKTGENKNTLLFAKCGPYFEQP